MKSEEYKAMSRRIKEASGDLKRLAKLDKSLVRIYDAGFFSTSEFQQLDLMIFQRRLKQR